MTYNQGLQVEIKSFEGKFREEMVSLWERSVRATHHFVTPDDLDYFKRVVDGINFHAFPVYCLVNENKVLGFVGVSNKKIEMLFLDPAFMGRGLGTRLVNYALKELRADKVDVNEQNEDAVKFYSKFGFLAYERDEKDSEGKDYPILKMRLGK